MDLDEDGGLFLDSNKNGQADLTERIFVTSLVGFLLVGLLWSIEMMTDEYSKLPRRYASKNNTTGSEEQIPEEKDEKKKQLQEQKLNKNQHKKMKSKLHTD